ncbi:MAG: carbohydrate ABC transporter substrate-binding protein, partial [Actinomycetales bacterium]|nr:carbohydrate ABC transporter substrate-binding protein [Actinomycetales bacterium]
MKFTRRIALAASAATAATAAIAGCSSSGGGSGGGDGGDVELTVATFNEFGYEDLFAKYEEENPGVK